MKSKESPYTGVEIFLTTKHYKSRAITKPFGQKLSARITEHYFDTDTLGTFSGEIERKDSPLECARKKCELAIEQAGATFALASEGSFGPHPSIPFVACDHEILYFIDLKHQFHFHLSYLSMSTNFRTDTIDSIETLHDFAKKSKFPSHALIIRPYDRDRTATTYKGINSHDGLEVAFAKSMSFSSNGKVWVETDMRAHMNPTRMAVIEELADQMADRLGLQCPKCETPGWGKVGIIEGLECSYCGTKTNLTKEEILGCTKCDHRKIIQRKDLLTKADPRFCGYCNP